MSTVAGAGVSARAARSTSRPEAPGRFLSVSTEVEARFCMRSMASSAEAAVVTR